MSIEETNRQRLKEAWAKWAESKGDPPSMWREYMSDDIQLFSLADGDSRIAFTEKRSGYAEIEEYLAGRQFFHGSLGNRRHRGRG